MVPCDPLLPVIPEWSSRSATDSDPDEIVRHQILGDSFPDVDRSPTPETVAMGMGQWAK